jgi:hypothetical protein
MPLFAIKEVMVSACLTRKDLAMFQLRTAKIALLVLVLLLVIGAFYAYAQGGRVSIRTTQDGVSVSLEANSAERLIPVQDIGVVKQGRANIPLTLSGNVVLVMNGIRITADSAVYQFGSNVIELNGGSVRIELPRP